MQLLTEQIAGELEQEAGARQVAVAQLALQNGLLDAGQVDMVDSLLRPHDVIPGYELLAVAGRGGMGVVYQARQKNLNRIVALKTVLLGPKDESNIEARFAQEAQAVAQLRHPNIVSAFDFGRHQQRLFFAMEFVEGEDSEQMIARTNQFDESTAWGLAHQAAAGLAHAAELGVVHRDIKPANLLLVEPPAGSRLPPNLPMVKIADFGLAFLTADVDTRTRLTSTKIAVGSPHYMSPEQIDGESIDYRSDIYSLGATVYHMLAGVPPFTDSSVSKIVVEKLMHDPPGLEQRRRDVSPASAQLVREMMARNPGDRVQDYNVLMQRIDAILGTKGTSRSQGYTSPAVGDGSHRLMAAGPNEPTIAVQRPDEPSLESSSVAESRISARTRRSLTVAGLALLGVAAAWFLWRSPNPPVPQDRVYSVVVGGEPLFDGQSLDGWIPRGEWQVDSTTEGVVLSGTSGFIVRRLSASPPAVPIAEHYRLTSMVRLNQAAEVELHFGAVSASVNAARYALRFTPAGVQLGQYASDSEQFSSIGQVRPLPRGPQNFYVVHLERQAENWWVFVEEQLLQVVPHLDDESQFPALRISVTAGPAWFSDLLLEQLTDESPTP